MTSKSNLWVGACALFLAAALVLPGTVQAQEEEGPGTRVMTVTSFNVPFQHRDVLFPYLVERVLPNTQLNPHVINYRVAIHNWGRQADQILLIAEYEDISEIEAECGQPCDDYFEANPAPEEGEDGYEEYQKAQELFSKYYSKHWDEIYLSPMDLAKVEGEMMGPVGGPEEEEEEGGM